MPRVKAHIPARTGLSKPEIGDIRELHVRRPPPDSGQPWSFTVAFTIYDDIGNAVRNAKAAGEFSGAPTVQNGMVGFDISDIKQTIIDALGLVEGDPE